MPVSPNAPLEIHIDRQPNDSTCGPTALHAVYKFLGLKIKLTDLLSEISYLKDGGTLAVSLGTHALKMGLSAELVTYNLKVFDPTWFTLDRKALVKKLKQQLKFKEGKRFSVASQEYIKFLEAGGNITSAELTIEMLDQYFDRGLPVLVGLSATYLYGSMREIVKSNEKLENDDVKGEPTGHFVVICGRKGEEVFVADPYRDNPHVGEQYYAVDARHLFHAILLGILTYDANLLIVWPKSG